MNIYLIILLRTTHIFASVLWVGSAILYLFFVEPSVKALGPAGPKFMQNFIEKRRYSVYMSVISLLTILSGALLYWNSSGGLQFNWIKSGPGIALTVGAIASLVALFVGLLLIKPRAERMGKLGLELGEAGNPPDANLLNEIQELDQELVAIERTDFILLVIALLTMITARYWGLLI
jgi:uncharacterized membrane protein